VLTLLRRDSAVIVDGTFFACTPGAKTFSEVRKHILVILLGFFRRAQFILQLDAMRFLQPRVFIEFFLLARKWHLFLVRTAHK